MRSIITKGIVLIAGLALFALMLVPAMSYPVSAGPLLAITSTPQEPAPPTSPPPPATAAPAPPEATSPSAPKPTAKPHEDHDSGTPDVSIVKTVDQSSVMRGDLMGFTLHITNKGDATAKDVVASDSVPSYLDIVDYSVSKGSVSVSGHTITANIGTLSTGEYVTVRFRAYLSADAPETGSNTGTVTNSNGDSNPNNNSSTVTFHVITPSPTLVPPTEVPPVPAPTAQPPTPQPPVRAPQKAERPPALPNTGEGDDQTVMLTAMLLLGLSGLGIGWAVRRRVQR